MYAIKIVSDTYTVFHQADEIVYENIKYISKEDFDNKLEEFQPDYVTGENKGDNGGYYIYMKLYVNPDSSIYKKIFVRPWSIIYIMQEGKTIEVIRVDEI